MPESINTVVIGAGVVGLACARALAQAGREVIVLERNDGIGQETSSRNSEVIHAGIYYAPGSLKARLCVDGKQALYAYCEAKQIPYRRIGKLIVATRPADIERLQQINDRARVNGVADLTWLDADAVNALEPAIIAAGALHSPSTGIIDVHALMLSLQGDLEAAGGLLALQSELIGARPDTAGLELIVESLSETTRLTARNVVNCGGLHASAVATLLHGDTATVAQTRYARGVYFEYAGAAPFGRLIYPMPESGGLGVHATVNMAGSVRFGPDVEWIDTLDYAVDPRRAEAFARSIARWWPDVELQQLRPAYAGIRPKLVGPGDAPADFSIARTRTATGSIIDLLGIESPGLTCALAIGDYVRALLQ